MVAWTKGFPTEPGHYWLFGKFWTDIGGTGRDDELLYGTARNYGEALGNPSLKIVVLGAFITKDNFIGYYQRIPDPVPPVRKECHGT